MAIAPSEPPVPIEGTPGGADYYEVPSDGFSSPDAPVSGGTPLFDGHEVFLVIALLLVLLWLLPHVLRLFDRALHALVRRQIPEPEPPWWQSVPFEVPVGEPRATPPRTPWNGYGPSVGGRPVAQLIDGWNRLTGPEQRRLAAVLDDPYVILGVDPATPGEDIRRAYHRAMRDAHPDMADAGDVERAQAVNTAYEVLKDERLRGGWDYLRATHAIRPSR